MTPRRNEFGQPIGPELPGWQQPPALTPEVLAGRYCRVEPIVIGPHQGREGFRRWLEELSAGADPMVHAIIDGVSSRVVGIAAFMRITPAAGSVEVGHVVFSPRLQRSTVATEAMFLMMRRAFELGYRRYEWKCDALNEKSRTAAQRLGFSFEGIFRQALVYKGRSRDTAWFSILDGEWPARRDAFERWLSPANFDADGSQRLRLSELTAPLLRNIA
jgi:RimJ/RimL family protein N-acetyltransferase